MYFSDLGLRKRDSFTKMVKGSMRRDGWHCLCGCDVIIMSLCIFNLIFRDQIGM